MKVLLKIYYLQEEEIEQVFEFLIELKSSESFIDKPETTTFIDLIFENLGKVIFFTDRGKFEEDISIKEYFENCVEEDPSLYEK